MKFKIKITILVILLKLKKYYLWEIEIFCHFVIYYTYTKKFLKYLDINLMIFITQTYSHHSKEYQYCFMGYNNWSY